MTSATSGWDRTEVLLALGLNLQSFFPICTGGRGRVLKCRTMVPYHLLNGTLQQE